MLEESLSEAAKRTASVELTNLSVVQTNRLCGETRLAGLALLLAAAVNAWLLLLAQTLLTHGVELQLATAMVSCWRPAPQSSKGAGNAPAEKWKPGAAQTRWLTP